MIDFSDVEGISEELAEVNQHINRLLFTRNESMNAVMQWVLASRGKQIRPLLVLLCSRLNKNHVDVTEMAAIIEICHTASLVHDDVIDDADERRGQLSVQRKFGREMAVYAGDFMIFATLGRTDLRLKPWYRDMFSNLEVMCEGELSQFDHQYDTFITEDQYIQNVIGKTSSMFTIACVSGCYEGKCTDRQIQMMRDFSRDFGLFFQLRDDLMDFLSCTEESKKSVQSDFRSGYYTLPAIVCFQDPEKGNELRSLAGKCRQGCKDHFDSATMCKLIRDAGGFEYTYNKIQNYANVLKKDLEVFPQTPARDKLIDLVEYLKKTTPQP